MRNKPFLLSLKWQQLKPREGCCAPQRWQVRRHLTVSQKRSVSAETKRTAGQTVRKYRVTSVMLCWSHFPPAACCKYGLTVWQEVLIWAQHTKTEQTRWQGQPQQFSLAKPFLHAHNRLNNNRRFPLLWPVTYMDILFCSSCRKHYIISAAF